MVEVDTKEEYSIGGGEVMPYPIHDADPTYYDGENLCVLEDERVRRAVALVLDTPTRLVPDPET